MEKNGTTQNHEDTPKIPSYRRYIIAAFLIPLIIIAALVFIWFTQEEHKPDPASEKIIREAAAEQLNKDPNELTDEDFAKITKITDLDFLGLTKLYDQPIPPWVLTELSDIRLLEKFTNLQELDLYSIKYPDKYIPK